MPQPMLSDSCRGEESISFDQITEAID